MPFNRRSPHSLAGSYCTFKNDSHSCLNYARYGVMRQDMNGKMEIVGGSCGAHTPYVIRQVWREFKTAAIVQEIPGMWHSEKADG